MTAVSMRLPSIVSSGTRSTEQTESNERAATGHQQGVVVFVNSRSVGTGWARNSED